MPFTELYCNATTGSNLNAGSTESGSAAFTFASGSWVAATGVFTLASGDTTGVSAGDWASVYADGSTVTGFVGRVTAVSSTTITVSLSAKSGTAPADGTSTRTLKIGGAWKGPNGAEAFPFGFLQNTHTNASGNAPRANFKVGTYSISAAITHANPGMTFQGYATALGDGGMFTLDAGANAILPLTVSAANGGNLADCIIGSSATTGTNAGLSVSGSRWIISRVVVHDVRGAGISVSGSENEIIECETYLCNKSNTALQGGIVAGGTSNTYIRCISHDNAGSNSAGFRGVGTCTACIADSNGADGFVGLGSPPLACINCEAYNNTGNGFTASGRGVFWENCNALKNGAWGFQANNANNTGIISNCGTGSGTQANTLGDIQLNASANVMERGNFVYASNATPWNAPDTGDFRISLAAAKGTARGQFTQTQSGYSGTVGYPDMGAAQHQETGGGGTAAPRGIPGIIVEQ